MNQATRDFVNTDPGVFTVRETASELRKDGVREISPLAFAAIANLFAVIAYGLMAFYWT
jgi:hypothetical protein